MVLSLLAKENNLFRVLIIHASLWESKSYETEMFFNASFNGFAVIFSGFSPWEIRAKQFAQHPQFSRIIYLFVQLLTSFLSLRRRRLTFYFLLQFQGNCQLLIKNQTSPKLTHFFSLFLDKPSNK